MKIYQGLKKVKLSKGFKVGAIFFIKRCKSCKQDFYLREKENIIKKDILILKKPQYKLKDSPILFFFKRTNDYERFVKERVILYKSVCPNCGKTTKLFYVRYPKKKRKFVYGKWSL